MTFDQWCDGLEMERTHSAYRFMRATWDAAILAAAETAAAQMSEPECPERAQYCASSILELRSNAEVSRAHE